jgi:hypothetical protein
MCQQPSEPILRAHKADLAALLDGSLFEHFDRGKKWVSGSNWGSNHRPAYRAAERILSKRELAARTSLKFRHLKFGSW